MTNQTVDLSRQGHVARIELGNPPTHTLTAVGVQRLHAHLDTLEADPELRVLILTGSGAGVFVAHYEVGELADASEVQQEAEAESSERVQLHAMHQLCLRLERLPAVTIAALNGSAAGGGFELALACDFRLAAAGPFAFGLPETSVGIIPGAGGTQRMARLLGTARALDLILHAKLLSPDEAQGLGLTHRVFPSDTFEADVTAFAEGLAARAPVALSAAKRAIHEGIALPLEEGLAVEQREFDRAMKSEDATGAMRAWLRGEAWEWQGK